VLRFFLVNAAWWAVVHTATGFFVHRLPASALQRGGVHRWERRVYERVGIRRWKDALPEAGALFRGGVSKRSVRRSRVGAFVIETRRAELGHWLAMVGGPVSMLWNPPTGDVAMVAYGVLVNAPFVAVQRYNRARALRVIGRSMP
jgi:glycosyl-4,4'-diaponeurosporenoate acyltransferase